MYSEAPSESFATGKDLQEKGTPLSETPFGQRTWEDVRRKLIVRLNEKWAGRAQPADIEDAVSSAMVDLIDYWIHLRSSVVLQEPGRNFNFAVKRGYWMASTFLYQILTESYRHVPLPDDGLHLPELVERGPEPEDFDPDEESMVQDFLSTLPDEEFRSWLGDYLAGVTVRASAQKHGVYRNAMQERRQRGLRRIEKRFRAYAATR